MYKTPKETNNVGMRACQTNLIPLHRPPDEHLLVLEHDRGARPALALGEFLVCREDAAEFWVEWGDHVEKKKNEIK